MSVHAQPTEQAAIGATFPTKVVPVGVATDSNGNIASLNLDSSGNLKTTSGGGGSGGTSAADEAAFTVGTTPGTPAMGVVGPTDTPSAGDLAVVALDTSRNQKVNVQPSASGVSGQFAVTATAQQLTSQACRRINQLQSDYANGSTAGLIIYWGYSQTTCYNNLAPGDATAPIYVSNLNAIWVKCTTSDTAVLNWAVEAA